MKQLVRKCSSVMLLATVVFAGCKKNGKSSEGELLENRNSGAAGSLEGEMSKDMIEFRDQFNGIKDQNDVAKLLKVATDKLLNGTYKDNDIRLVAAQLLPLLELRSVMWRLAPIVEREKALHSAVVSSMMAIATGSRILAPVDVGNDSGSGPTFSWKAVNRYLAWPHQGGPSQFQNMSEFQQFLMQHVGGRLEKSIEILEGMKIPDDKPVVWDNSLIFGRGSFGGDHDSKDRYTTLYDGERLLILSGLYAMRHNIVFFFQYNVDQLPAYISKLGRLIGIDGGIVNAITGAGGVDGLSALDRAKALCGDQYPAGGCTAFPNLFTKRTIDRMPEAKLYLDRSIDRLDLAWQDVKRRGGSSPKLADFQILDPSKILPWTRLTDANITNIKAMIAGQPVHSAVTGRIVQVNIPRFYAESPNDLKIFMPKEFDPAPRRITVDGIAQVRNYEYGMSKKWDIAAYGKYFQAVNGKAQLITGEEVPEIMRDLGQTWGGWFAATPLALTSMVF